ncbi:hypothetical protein C1X67_07660 [Pseudomonas sp. FW305-62]|uniref:Uncharacterized protein n=1 Tax=Pseudomonas frederiksbergensis TaxID=104087 RepID=A0AB33E8C1_9PSED|nr:hypothetical protein CNN82_06240 [Pseudomonas frederiksbergensis]PMY85030.1 hypothetical protein C1X68_21370 [Pseudomonas sp. FW303-C2]PMY93382.1 hypothetical protein C1X67_07660 [Pseudomonas sp. FW305-62]PNA43406.1 hypothetical protein C1X71_12005 [Pseudomonas sp. FW306-2-2C-A10BC]PNA88139.1 hypothetical protein C1X66_05210 [Pseudomonas sp. MPR-R3B]
MRFIRTMKRNTWNREKMWAGQTAPFFACRKAKRPARGLFGNAREISVRGVRSCLACHPIQRNRAMDLSVQ